MPNQTSYDCADALERDKTISRGNTIVEGGYLILFGNKIAYKAKSGGILELNGSRWDGEWTKI